MARCRFSNNSAQYRACNSDFLSRPVEALRRTRLDDDDEDDVCGCGGGERNPLRRCDRSGWLAVDVGGIPGPKEDISHCSAYLWRVPLVTLNIFTCPLSKCSPEISENYQEGNDWL